MSSCYPTVLPMKAGSSFTFNQVENHFPIDLIAYQRLIRKLMYLVCRTRPDIAFIIRQLSSYNSDLRISHICITKQTLQYLKETSTLGII